MVLATVIGGGLSTPPPPTKPSNLNVLMSVAVMQWIEKNLIYVWMVFVCVAEDRTVSGSACRAPVLNVVTCYICLVSV